MEEKWMLKDTKDIFLTIQFISSIKLYKKLFGYETFLSKLWQLKMIRHKLSSKCIVPFLSFVCQEAGIWVWLWGEQTCHFHHEVEKKNISSKKRKLLTGLIWIIWVSFWREVYLKHMNKFSPLGLLGTFGCNKEAIY